MIFILALIAAMTGLASLYLVLELRGRFVEWTKANEMEHFRTREQVRSTAEWLLKELPRALN